MELHISVSFCRLQGTVKPAAFTNLPTTRTRGRTRVHTIGHPAADEPLYFTTQPIGQQRGRLQFVDIG
jgi:hypothetical protein